MKTHLALIIIFCALLSSCGKDKAPEVVREYIHVEHIEEIFLKDRFESSPDLLSAFTTLRPCMPTTYA